MNDQMREILNWLLAAKEYLIDSSIILNCSLKSSRSRISRPTSLLFGYFLENLLKAIIIKRKGLSESESFEHVSAKLFLEAGFSIEDKFENQMVGFLSEIIKWGKYPKRKKGDSGTFLKSTSKFYANETVFFTDSNNFNNLLQFSLKVIEYAEKILLENVAQEDEIYFRETLERLYGLVIANSENIKNKPK